MEHKYQKLIKNNNANLCNAYFYYKIILGKRLQFFLPTIVFNIVDIISES